MSAEKKLFLLDAMALIYRAYFAFSNNHRINSKGQNTSAVFGFTNTLLDVLKNEKPTHIAVVFDTAAPTSRHEEFTDYKANRQEIPEDLAASIPVVVKLCEAFRIPVLAIDGYEADDVIGTMAKIAEKEGFRTYMMTPDKDFGQLVDSNTFIYKPARAGGKAEIMGVEEVCKRWEIENVEQVIDILGLMGDKVDNIPGIPGIGEKTAIQLVKQFGSIENLLENTDQLKGKLKEKVEQNKEMAIQSKYLATIIVDAPVDVSPEDLKLQEPDREAVSLLFADLEFRRLADQLDLLQSDKGTVAPGKVSKSITPAQATLFGVDEEESNELLSSNGPKVLKNISEVKHDYILADTEKKRKELISQLSSSKEFCFDTETTGLDTQSAELVGMSFAIKVKEAFYVPVPDNFESAKKICLEFSEVFANEKIRKIAQNLKYDLSILKRYGIDIRGELFDTMIAHFLIRPEMRHSMDVLAETYLNYSPVSIESLIGKKGKDQKSMRDVPLEQITEYAAEDADITLQLYSAFVPELKTTKTEKLFHEVEMPLVPVLADMESEGISLNVETLEQLSDSLANDISSTEMEIQKLAGAEFNISSPKQVGEVLFDRLKISDKPAKTKTGQYSTSEDVLSKLENKHPIVRMILDYRELNKLKNTYVDVLPQLVNPSTGRIHTSFNQVVAVTGRLSSDNPNLQNIPIRTEKGREIRKAFVPRGKDYLLFSADYSQIELRIIAELSGDEGMLEAFRSGEDIHAATASKVYGVPLKDVNSDMRRNAKMVNFGIIYGISAFGLADRLNISRTEAKEIIDNYFIQYPQIKDYMDLSIESARKKGYVETILGRRRYLRDINSANATVRGFAERNAINAPIQGSAADMIKVAMINIHKDIRERKLKSRMLLQVHDELVFDCHRDEQDTLKELVTDKMKNAIKLKVPVDVGVGFGENWLEAH
ncbi:MAG: DNA polymerase I [Bacteroidetes bacterium]|nr:MAG: DNA polymerase I [Bacteroidota bacterium]REK00666.1 MAG: DNA polymerase I [Bacteroidota bacterium]REK35212.1 MAG: DNA polymerase I [Bacteroidota bacterium]REK48289.1 MAG: DNA polymerase I [Bacteroidota bacterium]